MAKEIIFTTLEDQGKRLREFSRALSPIERLAYLQELNRRAFGAHLPKVRRTPSGGSFLKRPSMSSSPKGVISDKEIRVFTKSVEETLEEFLRRVRQEKRAHPR